MDDNIVKTILKDYQEGNLTLGEIRKQASHDIPEYVHALYKIKKENARRGTKV